MFKALINFALIETGILLVFTFVADCVDSFIQECNVQLTQNNLQVFIHHLCLLIICTNASLPFFLFFFFGRGMQQFDMGSQFPDQGSNLDPRGEST